MSQTLGVLSTMLGHSLAVFDDDRGEFEILRVLDLDDRHLFPGQAHVFRHREYGVEYLYFGEVFPTVRVKADWQHYTDPAAYEVFTCFDPDGASDNQLLLDADGRVQYHWRSGGEPVDGAVEQRFIAAGRLPEEQARFLPIDSDTGRRVLLHRGSVRWNEYRQLWIAIATQADGSSLLGEAWYSQAMQPTGPWRRANKIVTHEHKPTK